MNRFGLTICAATAALTITGLYACAANAQAVEAVGAAQAIAISQTGGGGGGSNNPQWLATTPDAIAASQSGGATFSCVVPRSSEAFSAAFIAVTSATFDLDRFCMSMTLTEANIGLAYAHAELDGLSGAVAERLGKAGALVDQATAVFFAGADAWASDPWASGEWRP